MDDFILVASGRQWRLEPRDQSLAMEVKRPPQKTAPVTAKAVPPVRFGGAISSLSIKRVVAASAEAQEISIEELCGRDTKQFPVRCRHITVLILKELYNVSRKRIGKALGGRDQQTIWFAWHRAIVLRDKDRGFAAEYERVKEFVLKRTEDWPDE